MKRVLLGIVAAILLLSVTSNAQAQVLAEGTITTAGADCSTVTNCSQLINLNGVASISIYVDVGTSGTFNFEYTNSNVFSVNQTLIGTETVVWAAVTDDVNAASTITSDGIRFFSNPGYRFMRVRASAINGAATYRVLRGYAPLKSTATLSGGGDASAANQVTGNGYLSTLASTVTGGAVTIAGSISASATNTDADNNAIAAAQTSDTANSLMYAYGGTTWNRVLFGQQTMANSLSVTLASNQSNVPISGNIGQSGTWTVQPGNTANTTAWLVTGTGGTFPVTQGGTFTVQPGNTANTTAWLVTGTGGTFPATQSGTWNVTTLTGGAVAHGAADSGNPLKVGGKYNSTPPTLNDGQRGDLQLDAKGSVKVVNVDPTTGLGITPGVACNTNTVISSNSASNVQLIAASGATTIYICSYSLTARGTTDVRLTTGTGTNCGTGTANVTGNYGFSTTTGLLGISRGSGLGMIAKGAASGAICIQLGSAVQVDGDITWTQF